MARSLGARLSRRDRLDHRPASPSHPHADVKPPEAKKTDPWSGPGALSLRELLAIPGFGLRCLVDLLTAVEGAHRSTETEGARPPTTELHQPAPLGLAPRVTHESRLLAGEAWSQDVGVYDARLAAHLLTSDDPLGEVRDAVAAGRLSPERTPFFRVTELRHRFTEVPALESSGKRAARREANQAECARISPARLACK